MKPGNEPSYVHAKSNHPPVLLKNLPDNINQRLSAISSDEEVFNKAAPTYQTALDRSVYSYTLKYDPRKKSSQKRRKRKRNITWFNPPFDLRVKTNIGRQFFRIVDDCFPTGHPLRRIFNRSSLRLSYSCMPSVAATISAHNKSS